jgi:hypothetical protein
VLLAPKKKTKGCGPLAELTNSTIEFIELVGFSIRGFEERLLQPLKRLPRMRLVEALAWLVSWRYAKEAGIAIRSIKPLASKSGLSVSRLLMRLGLREAAQPAGRAPLAQGCVNAAGCECATPCSASGQLRHETAGVIRSPCMLHGLC